MFSVINFAVLALDLNFLDAVLPSGYFTTIKELTFIAKV
jgi:hypothetical protein